MAEAFIIDAVRTPRSIGKLGKGALSHMHPQHVAATVLKALKDRNNLNTAEVDDVIWGTSAQFDNQGGDLGRMAALDAGFDVKASGVTLDRFCGSGITATSLAAAQIMSGMEDCVIAGGCEMMSYTSSTADPKTPPMMDAGNLHLRSIHPQSQQGVCADAIATLFLTCAFWSSVCLFKGLYIPAVIGALLAVDALRWAEAHKKQNRAVASPVH